MDDNTTPTTPVAPSSPPLPPQTPPVQNAFPSEPTIPVVPTTPPVVPPPQMPVSTPTPTPISTPISTPSPAQPQVTTPVAAVAPSKKSGFNLLTILLIVVVLLLISGVIFLVYALMNKPKTDTNLMSTEPIVSPSVPVSPPPVASVTAMPTLTTTPTQSITPTVAESESSKIVTAARTMMGIPATVAVSAVQIPWHEGSNVNGQLTCSETTKTVSGMGFVATNVTSFNKPNFDSLGMGTFVVSSCNSGDGTLKGISGYTVGSLVCVLETESATLNGPSTVKFSCGPM